MSYIGRSDPSAGVDVDRKLGSATPKAMAAAGSPLFVAPSAPARTALGIPQPRSRLTLPKFSDTAAALAQATTEYDQKRQAIVKVDVKDDGLKKFEKAAFSQFDYSCLITEAEEKAILQRLLELAQNERFSSFKDKLNAQFLQQLALVIRDQIKINCFLPLSSCDSSSNIQQAVKKYEVECFDNMEQLGKRPGFRISERDNRFNVVCPAKDGDVLAAAQALFGVAVPPTVKIESKSSDGVALAVCYAALNFAAETYVFADVELNGGADAIAQVMQLRRTTNASMRPQQCTNAVLLQTIYSNSDSAGESELLKSFIAIITWTSESEANKCEKQSAALMQLLHELLLVPQSDRSGLVTFLLEGISDSSLLTKLSQGVNSDEELRTVYSDAISERVKTIAAAASS